MADFKTMTWLNPPPVAEFDGQALTVKTGSRTDFWRGTFYGFWRDTGHFLYQSVAGDFTCEVTIQGKFEELYDQAGLMVRLSESCWVKAGIEYTDGAMHFSVVVTNDHSDWSQLMVRADDGRLRLRLTRHGDTIRVQYLDQTDDNWKAARLAYIPPTQSIDLGVMCCSPQREGFEVTFTDFEIREPISRDLH